jgi:hypothetical protein
MAISAHPRSMNVLRWNSFRALSLSLLVGLAALVFSSCSSTSDRSTAAYCTTFYQQGTQLRSQFTDSNSQNPLNQLVSLIGAPQQLATFFRNLAAVAPNSISSQVSAIQDAFQQEANNAGSDAADPLGGIVSGLVSSIETGPAFEAVNNWTDSNCGPPPGTKWLNN